MMPLALLLCIGSMILVLFLTAGPIHALEYSFLTLNMKLEKVSLNYVGLVAKKTMEKEGIVFEVVPDLGTAAGIYKRTFDRVPGTSEVTVSSMEIKVLESLEETSHVFVILHELGHHFRILNDHDVSEEGADLWIRDFAMTLPLWMQAVLETPVHIRSRTDERKYDVKDIKKSMKADGITLKGPKVTSKYWTYA